MGKVRKKVLLVDGNNAFYRGYHKLSELKTLEGLPSGGVFGTVSIIQSLLRKNTPDKIIVCWDGKKSPERLKLYPEYKGKRKKKTEEQRKSFYAQLRDTQGIIHALGITQVVNKDLEADDQIYYLHKKFLKKGYNVVISSTDKDFHQLITNRVKVWNDTKGEYLTPLNLKSLYHYEPNQVVDYLSLLGDSSDNIPGVPGVGEKSVQKFFELYSSIREFLESDEEKVGRIHRDKVIENIDKARMAIDLKLFYDTHLKGNIKTKFFNDEYKPKLDIEEVKILSKKYQIRKFIKDDFLFPIKSYHGKV